MRARASILTALLVSWRLPLSVFAQTEVPTEVQGEIIAITRQISQQPANANLYLRRGDLYRAQQNWDAAQADFSHASTLNPNLDAVDFSRGRMFLEANWPRSAKVALDRFLTTHTNHVEALIARARTLIKLEDRLGASQDYSRAIQLAPESHPELYLERAQTLAAAGGAHIKEALQGLDEGIKKLGPLVALQMSAIDIEVSQKHYDNALARIEAAAAASRRKETWLSRKGEILRQAGRNDEARTTFQAALNAIETLPPARKNVPATLELQQRIREQLEGLR